MPAVIEKAAACPKCGRHRATLDRRFEKLPWEECSFNILDGCIIRGYRPVKCPALTQLNRIGAACSDCREEIEKRMRQERFNRRVIG